MPHLRSQKSQSAAGYFLNPKKFRKQINFVTRLVVCRRILTVLVEHISHDTISSFLASTLYLPRTFRIVILRGLALRTRTEAPGGVRSAGDDTFFPPVPLLRHTLRNILIAFVLLNPVLDPRPHWRQNGRRDQLFPL